MDKTTEAVSSRGADLHHALVDALSEHIALISNDGTIVAVNQAWTRFARENGNPHLVGAAVGDNYLRASKGDAGDSGLFAHRAGRGISDVLCRARERFEIDYTCHSPSQERWCRMEAFRIPRTPDFIALIHRDITEYERLREALREQDRLGEILSDGSGVGAVDLAPRQRQVLELFTRGFSNKEIAFTMEITTKIVDYHITTLKTKLRKQRRAELVRAGMTRDPT